MLHAQKRKWVSEHRTPPSATDSSLRRHWMLGQQLLSGISCTIPVFSTTFHLPLHTCCSPVTSSCSWEVLLIAVPACYLRRQETPIVLAGGGRGRRGWCPPWHLYSSEVLVRGFYFIFFHFRECFHFKKHIWSPYVLKMREIISNEIIRKIENRKIECNETFCIF